ncbi:MAG: hypothetical protein RIF41_10175 [Polyangiaceae bacterium]
MARDAMLRLAAAPTVFEPLTAGEERIERDDFVLFIGASSTGCVQGLRCAPRDVAEVVSAARGLARRRGVGELTWEAFAETGEAPALAYELTTLGMRDGQPPNAIVMGLTSTPGCSSGAVVVEPVTTVEQFRSHVAVSHEVFGRMDALPAELERIDREGASQLAEKRFVRYTARLDGAPVGVGTATFTEFGAMFHSGCTLKEYRKRGVYSALVARRWRDAADRGTSHVVVRAGRMSRPILHKLGFTELGEVRFFVDVCRSSGGVRGHEEAG